MSYVQKRHMKYVGPAVLATMLLTPAFADERAIDSISTPGRAAAEVSPDEILINFQLEIESDSFSEAVSVADETATRLEKVLPPVDGVSVKVNYDVTFMRQKKWGRGSKLAHRFGMSVRNVPDGAAQETLVYFVDKVVKLEPRMTVEGYEARLSEAKSQQVRDRLLSEAVEDARHNAAVIAKAGGLVVGSPHSIVSGARPSEWTYELDGNMYEQVRVRSRYFSVTSDLGSSVPVAVSVWVVFNATPQ